MPDEELTPLKILHQQPRLGRDDSFTFECGRQRDCFTKCCRDVSIVLTPYDVLRLKRALGIEGSEFLRCHTISPFTKDQKLPVVLLKMGQDGACPFATPEGCSVYTHRPWACRMYPLGAAEPKSATPEERGFHFLIREDLCHGHGQGREWTVAHWLRDQGIEQYELHGASFKDLMLHEFWDGKEELTPQQMNMYFMCCYDLDRFRRFAFDSTFLARFEVDEARVEAMRGDDEELLEFAMQWLRFLLLRERTMKIKPAPAPVAERANLHP